MSGNLLKIGLSLPCKDCTELQNFEYIPDCFEFAELSGETVADALHLHKEHNLWSEFEFFDFRDLIPPALASQITPENHMILQDFKKQLRKLFASASLCKAQNIGIDPGWENLCSDAGCRELFNDILRSTAGDREFYDLQMLLTVRLPGSGALPVTESLNLLHRLNNYRVNLALDIYPHELINSNIEWEKLLAHFRFDVKIIRFCYPSELGNKLLYQHIAPVVDAVRKWQQEVYIYFAPSGKADLDELAETAQQINPKEYDHESQ